MIFSVGPERPALEVADLLREHGESFLTKYGDTLTDTQRKTLSDLGACRTAALGGHVERCLDCGHERLAYNSCRNRHCPKCQALARARWLLLPLTAVANTTAVPTQAATDVAEVAPAQRPICPKCGSCRLESLELGGAAEAVADRRENSS